MRRVHRLTPASPAALTVAPAWGISAAPSRDEAFGRGGPWEGEATEVERAYGPASTIHVSLEEFARTLPSAKEDRERFREGGVAGRALARRLARSRRSGELERLRTAFARFRAFDRPNVLHLFAGLERNAAFAREFPAAVQTGPLWPRRYRGTRRGSARAPGWVWYASPSSAERVASDVLAGLGECEPPVPVYIRSPRLWKLSLPSGRATIEAGPVGPAEWSRRFARADTRIVTGSRSLLEALELGGRFLYFNGTLGDGTRRRRHRPEKIEALLSVLRRQHVRSDLLRDLAAFARGQRVREVVRRAASRAGGWSKFPDRIRPVGFVPPYDDAGRLVVRTARALARHPRDALRIVAAVRAGSAL
jgi:hypothetical protein